MGTSFSFRDGPHRWIPKVGDLHGGGPDFLWHPWCYVEQYGIAELERLIGEAWRLRMRFAPKPLPPGS